MRSPGSVVIVGESLAGLTAARELRTLGYTGRLAIVGDEPHAGYSRPPLSKQVLRDGDGDGDDSHALPADGLDAEFHRSPAIALDVDSRQVHLASGASVPYDALVIATGASAREIAAPAQRGEIVLRTLDDARLLRRRLDAARSAIVVGAGFLGMEIASECARRGLPVTVVDVEPPLRRLLGPFLSELVLARAHVAGIDIRLSPTPAILDGDPVRGVRFADGTTLTADLVVTCAGDMANTRWLTGTGLELASGVLVDEAGRTSHPDVYAAGDVVSVQTCDGIVRRPFWSNAVAQGRVVAHSILGAPKPPAAFDNYFWTEILGTTVKVIGDLPLDGEPEIVEGTLDAGAILRWSNGSRPTVVAWGVKRPVPRLRALAATRTSISGSPRDCSSHKKVVVVGGGSSAVTGARPPVPSRSPGLGRAPRAW